MARKRAPEEKLNCIGYFGFGGGYQMGDAVTSENLYCQRCPLADPCWQRHRGRVIWLFPASAAKFEHMALEMGGPEAAAAWREENEQADPFTMMMFSNIQAGTGASKGEPLNDVPWDEGKHEVIQTVF